MAAIPLHLPSLQTVKNLGNKRAAQIFTGILTMAPLLENTPF